MGVCRRRYGSVASVLRFTSVRCRAPSSVVRPPSTTSIWPVMLGRLVRQQEHGGVRNLPSRALAA